MRSLMILLGLIVCAVMFSTSAQEATPSSTPILNIREPTLAQLEAYLLAFSPISTNPNFSDFNWYDSDPIIYVDLNGDEELDLLVEGYRHLAVLVWLGERYSEPFQLYSSGSPRNPWSQVTLEDWTNDRVPEVIFKTRDAYSGTGIGGHKWFRTVIQCDTTHCFPIWEGEIADYFYMADLDGISLRQTMFSSAITVDNTLTIRAITTEFAFNCTQCYLANDLPIPEGSPIPTEGNRVGAIIERLYAWNGRGYELIDETILEEASVIEIPTQMIAESALGVASVTLQMVDNPRNLMRRYQQCQPMLDNQQIGEPFFCLFPFVQWRDITGDNQEELLISAFSGFNGAQDDEKACAHQRLMVFEYRDEIWTEITNVIGCLFDSNLYGIRLEDIDDDDALEIIAGGTRFSDFNVAECIGGFCWYELGDTDEVYDWNGHQYEFLMTIPRQVNLFMLP